MEDLRPDGVLKNFRTVYIYIYIILVRAAESRLRYDEIITHRFSNHRILYKQDSSFTISAEAPPSSVTRSDSPASFRSDGEPEFV